MTKWEANGLRLFAGWTIFVWVTRIKNILGDDSTDTAFKAVHSILAVVSIALAILCLWIVRRNRKRDPRTPPV